MNSNQQQPDQGQQFTQQHNDIYNALRDALMGFHAQGVPGMDQVLNQLNKTHQSLAAPKAQPAQQPANQGRPTGAGGQAQQGLQQAQQQMNQPFPGAQPQGNQAKHPSPAGAINVNPAQLQQLMQVLGRVNPQQGLPNWANQQGGQM